MYKLEIIKKFEKEFKNIIFKETKMLDNYDYFNNIIVKKVNLRFSSKEKEEIIARFDFLRQYSDQISNFLGNSNYANLVKENIDNNDYTNIINKIKNIQIENGLLIEKYYRVISALPSLFTNYFNGKVEKHGTYDKDINTQFKNAFGYNEEDNYSISDFYRWVINQKIIGEDLINQLNGIEREYNLKFAEINKGLFDSLFIGHKSWKLITPNSYTFDNLDESNIIRGKIVYECGTSIKDGYKTYNFLDNIDTIVLHNPYNLDEIETLINISDDYNTILSFFGSKSDKDFQEKIMLYNKYLVDFKDKNDNKVFKITTNKAKQYVNTIVSIKK